MEKLKSELDEAEELVIKQKREINDLKNAKEGVESEVSRYKKTKTRLQNEINTLNAIFDQEKRDLSELEAKIRKQGKVCSIFKLNFLWSIFSRIRTESGDLLCKSPNSVRMRENKEQKNTECRHFLRCVKKV